MADQHNMLFICPDWVGFDDRVPVRTPTIDDLVARGVAFRNAVTLAPLCGPAGVCLASGMSYGRCGVRDHRADFPVTARNVYRRLRTKLAIT